MSFISKVLAFFRRETKGSEKPEPVSPAPVQSQGTRMKKACKNCGKMFSYDPAWKHIPNYCKECRQKFIREKEEKQRAGAPRKIKRQCKACGRYFTFPNTLEHYPNYCSNCRKQHQAEMKAKYSRKKA